MQIYADNAATTKPSKAAVRAMLSCLEQNYGNPSSLNHVGQAAAEALLQARQDIAGCLGCTAREIYFTSGGSEADNQALRSAAYAGARSGKKHLISTAIEHHAILHTLKQLEEEKQPFTFLMPASAAIYQPFGFTFIQNQRRGRLCRRQERAVLRAAGLDPEEKIVPWPAHPCPERVNAWLEESSGLYTLRSGAYYTRLCREQQAQGGDVFVILEGSEAVGTFCTAREGAQTTLRELICCPGKEEQVRRALDAYGYGGVQVEGCLPGIDLEEEQEIHLYMARPVCLPTLLDGLCRKGKPGAEAKEWKFTVVDPILPENSGSYVIWQKENGLSWERRSLPEEKAIDIGELFGYLEELSPFAGGFLNETV